MISDLRHANTRSPKTSLCVVQMLPGDEQALGSRREIRGRVTDQRLDFFDALARPLREQIRSGALAPGALLPSEAELARSTGTKRYSVRKVLSRLREEGLIEAIPGRGWAVVVAGRSESGNNALLPRYRQIAAELRGAIQTGQLAVGCSLPSEAELMRRFSVSRATARQALTVLELEGLITTRPGKGRYVRGD